MDPITAGLVMGGIGGIGGYFSAKENAEAQEKTNAANLAIAREQMAFQERMSNTAHQREIKDLEAAGLNPILSATKGGGASSPSGASATMVAPRTGDALRDSVNSGMALAQLSADLDLKRADVAKTLVDTINSAENTKVIRNAAEGGSLANAKQQATLQFDIDKANSETALARARAVGGVADAKRSQVALDSEAAQLPAEKAEAGYRKGKADLDKQTLMLDKVIDTASGAASSITSAIGAARAASTPLGPVVIQSGSKAEKEYLRRAGRKGLPVK